MTSSVWFVIDSKKFKIWIFIKSQKPKKANLLNRSGKSSRNFLKHFIVRLRFKLRPLKFDPVVTAKFLIHIISSVTVQGLSRVKMVPRSKIPLQCYSLQLFGSEPLRLLSLGSGCAFGCRDNHRKVTVDELITRIKILP